MEAEEAKGRVMRDPEKIKEQIKSLLSKTVANGCTEAEMLSALAKAQAMMDAYQITDADIRRPETKPRCSTPRRRRPLTRTGSNGI